MYALMVIEHFLAPTLHIRINRNLLLLHFLFVLGLELLLILILAVILLLRSSVPLVDRVPWRPETVMMVKSK